MKEYKEVKNAKGRKLLYVSKITRNWCQIRHFYSVNILKMCLIGQSLLQKHCFSFISALFLKDLTKISLDYFRMFSNICIKIGGVFKIFTKIGKDGIRGC